jgi:hypothetical protein
VTNICFHLEYKIDKQLIFLENIDYNIVLFNMFCSHFDFNNVSFNMFCPWIHCPFNRRKFRQD